MLNSRGGLFKAVEAALEVTHFGRAVVEAEGLADVHVFPDGSVEKRCVDVKVAEFKVAGGCDGQEETHDGHADDWGESLCVVQSSALAAPLGDEPRFGAGDVAGGIRLDFEDPHVINDHSASGEVHKFPRAVGDEGGILMLHSCLPLGGLSAVQRSPAGFRFHTLPGGEEGDGNRGLAGGCVWVTSDKVGDVNVLKYVLLSFALFRITTYRHEGRGVVGQVGNHIAVSNGV
jgi:hypothetical protein